MNRMIICPCTRCSRCVGKLNGEWFIADKDLLVLCKECSVKEKIISETKLQRLYKEAIKDA